MVKKTRDPRKQPATKGDVDDAIEELAQVTNTAFVAVEKDIRGVKDRLDGHDTRLERIERVLKMILSIVKSIDRDNKEFKQYNLPTRVSELEDDVLKLKARVR